MFRSITARLFVLGDSGSFSFEESDCFQTTKSSSSIFTFRSSFLMLLLEEVELKEKLYLCFAVELLFKLSQAFFKSVRLFSTKFGVSLKLKPSINKRIKLPLIWLLTLIYKLRILRKRHPTPCRNQISSKRILLLDQLLILSTHKLLRNKLE